MNVGYVGLGAMGGAIARRLMASRPLVVFDLDPEAVARLVADGARAASSAADLARQCDVILMCLPTSDHVQKAIFGPTGLEPGLRPGVILVDQSTGDPQATRAMAKRLEPLGVDLADAPVTGGVAAAEAGVLTIMVGAEDAQFERLEPVFADVSPNVFRAGGIGAGQVVKIANNLLSGVQRLLTQEAMVLAAKNGVDPDRALEILMTGGGSNAYMQRVLAPRVMQGQLAVNFTLWLACKDIMLASALGSGSGVDTPFADLAAKLYREFIDEAGYGAEVETSGLITQRRARTRYIPANHTI